jgi:hypothetical protein
MLTTVLFVLGIAVAGVMVGCRGEEASRVALELPPTIVLEPTLTPAPTVDLAPYLTDGCAVTAPNGSVPPGETASFSRNVLGAGAIWVGLYPQGTVVFEPGGPGGRDAVDGALSMKFWWWRGVPGRLEITGQRLDGQAQPLTSSVPDGYGNIGFQATSLSFPTPGCWQVTARVGDAELTFVTRVVSLY